LSYASAATKLEWLMTQAHLLRLSGVGLKEDAPETQAPGLDAPRPKALDSAPRKLRS
jgi:hypothetical protein